MAAVFISAKAGGHDIALTNSKMVSQKNWQKKDDIPKTKKFRYVTLLTVTVLWGYDHGLPIGNSHGKKRLANIVHKRYLQFDVYVSLINAARQSRDATLKEVMIISSQFPGEQ